MHINKLKLHLERQKLFKNFNTCNRLLTSAGHYCIGLALGTNNKQFFFTNGYHGSTSNSSFLENLMYIA